MMEAFIGRSTRCGCCGHGFSYHFPKPSAYCLQGRDTDWCPHYQGVNPEYYRIVVCPRCHYATSRQDRARALSRMQKRAASEALDQIAAGMDLACLDRTLFAALAACQLAIRVAPVTAAPLAAQARHHLGAAWLCRYGGQLAREQAYLERARDLYISAFDSAERPGDSLAATYLLGELCLRTGDLDRAVGYFKLNKAKQPAWPALSVLAAERIAYVRRVAAVKTILAGIRAIETLDERTITLLAVHAGLKMALPGASVFGPSLPRDALYLVASGTLEIQLGRSTVAVLGAGDFFDGALFRSPYKADLHIVSGVAEGWAASGGFRCSLLELNRAVVRSFLQTAPAVWERLNQGLSALEAACERDGSVRWMSRLPVGGNKRAQRASRQ